MPLKNVAMARVAFFYSSVAHICHIKKSLNKLFFVTHSNSLTLMEPMIGIDEARSAEEPERSDGNRPPERIAQLASANKRSDSVKIKTPAK